MDFPVRSNRQKILEENDGNLGLQFSPENKISSLEIFTNCFCLKLDIRLTSSCYPPFESSSSSFNFYCDWQILIGISSSQRISFWNRNFKIIILRKWYHLSISLVSLYSKGGNFPHLWCYEKKRKKWNEQNQ